MKVIKKEVKTFYTIKIDVDDVNAAIEKAKEEYKRLGAETYELIYHEAFKALLSGNIEQGKEYQYKTLILEHVNGNSDLTNSLRYIVKFLGFDGVEHFGNYNARTITRDLTVYNNGDDMEG